MDIWYRASIYGELDAIPVEKFNERLVWFKKGYYTRTERIESADHCWFQCLDSAKEYLAMVKQQRELDRQQRLRAVKARNVGPQLAAALQAILDDRQNFLTQDSYSRAKAALEQLEV